MDAPDELVEAVAQALADEGYEQDERSDPHAFYDYWPDMARAALSVPALAEVIARDAKVREIVDDAWSGDHDERARAFGLIHAVHDPEHAAALYPEAGKPDDSDIMPGSEFDGPVIL